MIHDGAVLESHDLRESFEERLAEIDKDLTQGGWRDFKGFQRRKS